MQRNPGTRCALRAGDLGGNQHSADRASWMRQNHCSLFAGLQRPQSAENSSAAFIFEETINTLIGRAAGLGMNLEPYMRDGRLKIEHLDPGGSLSRGVRRHGPQIRRTG